MMEYCKLLSLSYFKEYGNRYILSELMKILGISSEQLDLQISELIEDRYIEYKNNMLTITDKGELTLISSNMDGYKDQDNEFIMLRVNQSEVWPIDKPYVPKKFLSKI